MIAARRAFGPLNETNGRGVPRRVTALDPAVEPADVVNRLADAAPGWAELLPGCVD